MSTPDTRPNMQQIADAAGVSKSAVSLALRNDPRISEGTRQRVQRIAEELGYRRNPIVDSLMTQLRAGRQPNFQSNLCLLNCSSERDLGYNHTFRRLREGVLRRAGQLGYGVEEFWLHEPGMRPQRLRQILETRGIRGILLVAALSADIIDPAYSDFWEPFACAVLGVTHLDNNLNCATNDQYLTARRAVQQVRQLGYRRPALFIPEEDDRLLDDKFSAGHSSGIRTLPAKDQIAPVFIDIENLDHAVGEVARLKPDVIITNKTELHTALKTAGYAIPKELGLVHLDWHDGITHLAGMRQNNRVVGSAGVDLVVAQLQRNEYGPQQYAKVVQIESAWVEGPSAKSVRRAKKKTARKKAKA